MAKRKEYRKIKLNKTTKGIFGNNIKRILKEKKLRQADLARMMNTSEQQISQYANANSLPSMSKVFEFAQTLGVQPIELLITNRAVDQLSTGRKVMDDYQLNELFKISEKLDEEQLDTLIKIAKEFL